MESDDFDLSKMTVEDLFRAKNERRKRLARLPFEEKIQIVKKLQAVSRSLQPVRAANKARRATGKMGIGTKTK
jgi:hypothetical protein